MNIKTLLGTSLLVNVLLLVVGAFLLKQIPGKPCSPPPADVQATNASPTAAEKPVVVPASAAGTAARTAGTNTFDWRRVESADYRQYIANLRASRCPEKTIRDIIIADVNDMFRERARSLSASTNRFEYWKPGSPLGGSFNEELAAKQQVLSQEKRELLKALLGDSAPTGLDPSTIVSSSRQRNEQMLDFLPADKLAPLMELEEKCSAKLIKAVKDARQGDPAALRKIYADKDAELLQLLTQEQKFEYELRRSDTAMNMRMHMGDFQPTEQQFRDMFQAQKAFDDEFGLTRVGLGAKATAEDKAQRKAANEELDARLESILGEAGYRLYTYELGWAYDELCPVAKKYNIPKETAFKVFDFETAARDAASKIRANQALSGEQHTAALAAIRTETETAIRQVLGNEAAQAYFKAGAWITRLGK